jgi:hypothetical protein
MTPALAGAYACSGIERIPATDAMLTMLPRRRKAITRFC